MQSSPDPLKYVDCKNSTRLRSFAIIQSIHFFS